MVVVSRIDMRMDLVTGEKTTHKTMQKQFKNNLKNIYTSSNYSLVHEAIANFGFIFFHSCAHILLYSKLFLLLFVYSNDYIRYYESCTRKEARQW